MSNPSRREFLRATGTAGLGLAAFGAGGTASARSQDAAVPANSKVQVLSIGVVGSIGSTDRHQIAREGLNRNASVQKKIEEPRKSGNLATENAEKESKSERENGIGKTNDKP